MSFTKNKIILFAEVIILMFFFTSCISISVTEDDIPQYGREEVELVINSINFGKGRDDDIYVALSYLYNNETLKELYGDDFEITAYDIGIAKSYGETFMFLWLYKGNAEYSFTIKDSTCYIFLSKTYWGDWTVDKCIIKNQQSE